MKRSFLRRRTPLKRSTAALKRSPLRAVSAKRAKVNRERSVIVAEMKQRIGHCEMHVVPECTNRPDDAHEVLTRARGGSILDPMNIVIGCRPCHSWITTHPKEAKELGLMRSWWDEAQ